MTKVFGILGYPLGHSLSPLMHHAAFKALGLDAIYAPFEMPPTTVSEVLRGLVACGIDGLNVTVPHKEAIVPCLNALVEDAKALGAVNTIVVRRGRLIGYNTDVVGFEQAMKELGWTRRRCTAMILGAGGAAKAVAWVCSRTPGSHLIIANRHRDRAQRLAEWLKSLRPQCRVEVQPLEGRVDVRGCDVLINATSLGMTPQTEAPSIRGLDAHVVVYDLVYNRTTGLVRQARRQGCVAASGISMLVYQGAASFELWWRRRAPVAVMRRAVERVLRAPQVRQRPLGR